MFPQPKTNHGGKRPGAGRPNEGMKRREVTLRQDQIEWLDKLPNASAKIRELIDKERKSPGG